MTTLALQQPSAGRLIELAIWDGWRAEPRDRRGRWTRVAISVSDIGEADRAKGNASLEGFRPLKLASDADAAQYLRRTAERLPAAQRDAVNRYTGDEFYRLNHALRAGDASDPEVRRLDAAMRPSPDDMIVTRHIDDLGDPRELAGRKITDKAFASTALGSPYAGGLGGVTLHIAVPKGTPVINAAAVSNNAHEREVILGRGTTLAISRVVPNAMYGHDAYAVVLPAAQGSLDFAEPASTPPPQPYPPGQQPPPPQQDDDDGLEDAAMATAIAALLLTALSATAVIAALQIRFALSALAWKALTAVLAFVMAHPPVVTGVVGAASAQTSRMNAARRAQYVLAATRRVTAAARDARAKGEPMMDAIKAQIAREQRYYSQHQAAMWNRASAAGKTDMAALEHGNLLGWLAKHDAHTSAECKAASGKNFYASAMPDIGFPGSVHPSCRCEPVAPWPGGKLLPSAALRYARAA